MNEANNVQCKVKKMELNTIRNLKPPTSNIPTQTKEDRKRGLIYQTFKERDIIQFKVTNYDETKPKSAMNL